MEPLTPIQKETMAELLEYYTRDQILDMYHVVPYMEPLRTLKPSVLAKHLYGWVDETEEDDF